MPRHMKATRTPGRSKFADEVLGTPGTITTTTTTSPVLRLRPESPEWHDTPDAPGPIAAPAIARTGSGRPAPLAADLVLRQEQMKRFGNDRVLLLRHSLQRLQKTQRLQLPRGTHAVATLDVDQLACVDCHDVLRCLRTGDQLDLRQVLADQPAAIVPLPETSEPCRAVSLDDTQMITASYEAALLSYNLLLPEGPGAGGLDVTVLGVVGMRPADNRVHSRAYVTLEAGPMSARTAAVEQVGQGDSCSCNWAEQFQFTIADGCKSICLQLYSHVEGSESRLLGSVSVDLTSLFAAGVVEHTSHDLYTSNGYKSRTQGQIQLRMEFTACNGIATDILERMQEAFEISETQHEEIISSLLLPDMVGNSRSGKDMSVEAMANLQNRLHHCSAVPTGVCMGTCPHYRLLLLQAKRPRDFSSDKAFDDWQGRQVAVVVNSLLALVRRLDNAEREAMVGINESSRLQDVTNSLATRFMRVVDVSHEYKTSAGFPEEDYAECLDELYDYAMEIYAKHDRSQGLTALPIATKPANTEPMEMAGTAVVPASLWGSLRHPLNTAMYETLCATIFNKDQVGRHDPLKHEVINALQRTQVRLGVSGEHAHLCLARLHFDEHCAAEQEARRDTTRNRIFVEQEREEMLTALYEHIFLSTQQQDVCASQWAGGSMSTAAEFETSQTWEFREEVTAPMIEHFAAMLHDHHCCDVELMPRALLVYTALKYPAPAEKVVQDVLTFAAVRLYEKITENENRPFGAATLGVVVRQVLAAVDVEIEKFERIWQASLRDSLVVFLRTMGARVRQDYETCACPGSIDEDVIRTVMLLQQLENRMLACGALNPASVILAHSDAWHGGASPFSKLAWDWIDDHGAQFQRSVDSFVDYETWESFAPPGRTSFSIDGLFAMFQEAMDTFFKFSIASDEMFICLTEHIVSACINYANGVVASCGDILDLVPPSPSLNACRRLKAGGITRTEQPDGSFPSNSSICVRMNNLDDGLRRFILFYSSAKERWAEFAFIGHSKILSMQRFDYLVKAVRDTFKDSTFQLIDFLGTKVIYQDLRAFLGDGLYLPTVADCRIDDVLAPLAASLRSLETMLEPQIARHVQNATYRGLVSCFQRVLLDGGEYRIFTPEDKQIFDEDFCAIKALFRRIEELSDVGAITRLLTLLEMSTANLIDFYNKACLQHLPSDTGDSTYQAETLKRVIAHRDDRMAKSFLKKLGLGRRTSLDLGVRLSALVGGNAIESSASGGADRVGRHTQADIDRIFRHAATSQR